MVSAGVRLPGTSRKQGKGGTTVTEKELRKLNRTELLEMLIAQSKRLSRVEEELSAAQKELERRKIAITTSGSLAEAALKLNGIFEAADQAAAQYLDSLREQESNAEHIIAEAEAHKGPSIVICYAPCINHGIKKGMNNVQQEMKDAVNSGYWNLYRYSPETKTFTLDSKEPTMPLYDFMKGEVRYASLELSFPENAKVLFAEAEEAAKEKYESYKRRAEK